MKTIGDELANNVIDVIRKLREENARLREALVVLMQFHPEDELGPTTEEYWTTEYKAAMGAARAALGTREAEG